MNNPACAEDFWNPPSSLQSRTSTSHPDHSNSPRPRPRQFFRSCDLYMHVCLCLYALPWRHPNRRKYLAQCRVFLHFPRCLHPSFVLYYFPNKCLVCLSICFPLPFFHLSPPSPRSSPLPPSISTLSLPSPLCASRYPTYTKYPCLHLYPGPFALLPRLL